MAPSPERQLSEPKWTHSSIVLGGHLNHWAGTNGIDAQINSLPTLRLLSFLFDACKGQFVDFSTEKIVETDVSLSASVAVQHIVF